MAKPEINLPAAPDEAFIGDSAAVDHHAGSSSCQKQVNDVNEGASYNAGPLQNDEQFSANTEKDTGETWPYVAPYLQADEPIVYHYLTFETELPSPNGIGPCRNTAAAPAPPELRNYVSPFTWSESRKNFMTWLSCTVTVVTAYTAGSYSPASQQLAEYWQISQVATYVGITAFTTGFAVAPMFLAPFSELNGRRPVFIATGILFVICQLCCAVTRSFPGMLLARFFAGVGGSTFSTMVGGVISDLYHTQGQSNATKRLLVWLTISHTETLQWFYLRAQHYLEPA